MTALRNAGASWVVSAVFAGIVLGAAVGVSPLLALGAMVGLAYVAAALTSLVAGLSMFTALIFFDQLGPVAAVVKLAGLVLAFAWFASLARRDGHVPFLPRERPLLAYSGALFVGWSALSVLWAADPGVSSGVTVRLALNFLLLLITFSALRGLNDVRVLMLAYIAAAAASCAYGLASGTTQQDSPDIGRVSGGIGDPNELAALVLPAFVFALFLLFTERGLLLRIALVCAVAISLVAIFLTQSRGGLLALAAALLTALAVSGPLRSRFMIGGLALVAFVTVVFVFVAPPSSFDRLGSFGGGTGRLDLWTVAVNVIGDHPVLGAGAGNFPVVEVRYGDVANLSRIDLVLDDTKVVHNTYLNVMTDLGLVGITLFGMLFVGVLVGALRGVRLAEAAGNELLAIYGRATIVAVVAMSVAFVFISAQYEKQFWLLIGVAAAVSSLSGVGASDAPQRSSIERRSLRAPSAAMTAR